MKHSNKLITLSLAASAAAIAIAAPVKFMNYRATQSADLPLPATVDSVSASQNKFDASQLLSARVFAHDTGDSQWKNVSADKDGRVIAATPAKGARIGSYATRIRPERYAKGKLVLKSTSRASLMVNGKEVAKKAKADSVAEPVEAALEMRPEVEYAIQVNLLSLADDKGKPEFTLEFMPDEGFDNVPLTLGNDKQRRFELEDISLGKRVINTSLSPDGRYLLLNYRQMFDADNIRAWSELRETASGRVVNASLPQGASWTPKGNTVSYTVKMDGDYDLYTMDAATGVTKLVAKGIPESDFQWSPDMTWLLYYKNVDGKKEEGVMKRVTEPDDRIPGSRDRAYLMKYDLTSGIATPLTYGGPTTQACDIAPDGKHLLYVAQRNTPSHWPFYDQSLIQLDVNTLATDTLVSGTSALTGAIYSPDGRKLFITGGPSMFDGIGLNAGEHPIPNDFDGQGFIYDLKSRTAKAMTRDFNPAIVGDPRWNAADNTIYFRAEDGFNTPIYSLDPLNGKITKLPMMIDTDSNFSIGENESDWLSYTGMSFSHIGAAYLLNLKTGKTRVLDDPMTERLDDIQFGKIDTWTFTAADGTVIDGRICLPPDFDPSKKYPLIVYYYGGTSPSSSAMHHPYNPQVFASRDYVVYVVNPSGTTGYGQEFSARHVNAWGDRTADEIIEGTKKFCDEHPFVDRKKIGCLGASYGGFMTQYLQTKTDLFAAAVSHAGISNVTSYWGEGYWGYSYNSVAAAKSYPWTNPDLFTKHGSLFNADKIHTPLLLLHGTDDTNVPIGESIQLFNALKVLGRTVEFITVEGQNHVITDYEKRKLWQNTIMAWFAKWLQDDPRWWDSMYK